MICFLIWMKKKKKKTLQLYNTLKDNSILHFTYNNQNIFINLT